MTKKKTICCPHCKQDFTQQDLKGSMDIIKAQKVINLCAAHFGVKGKDIYHTRLPARVKARHLSFYLLHRHCNYTAESIGERFGRDHSTVLFGIKRVENALFTQTDVYEDLKIIQSKL